MTILYEISYCVFISIFNQFINYLIILLPPLIPYVVSQNYVQTLLLHRLHIHKYTHYYFITHQMLDRSRLPYLLNQPQA